MVARGPGYQQSCLSVWLRTAVGRVDFGFATDRIGTLSPGRRSLLGQVPELLTVLGIERMVFVLKRTPAFQLFGPFQDRSQAEAWIKRHANKRRYVCCILEPIDPPFGQVKRGSSPRHLVKRRSTLPPDQT